MSDAQLHVAIDDCRLQSNRNNQFTCLLAYVLELLPQIDPSLTSVTINGEDHTSHHWKLTLLVNTK